MSRLLLYRSKFKKEKLGDACEICVICEKTDEMDIPKVKYIAHSQCILNIGTSNIKWFSYLCSIALANGYIDLLNRLFTYQRLNPNKCTYYVFNFIRNAVNCNQANCIRAVIINNYCLYSYASVGYILESRYLSLKQKAGLLSIIKLSHKAARKIFNVLLHNEEHGFSIAYLEKLKNVLYQNTK